MAYWQCKTNPLEIVNRFTGQKILFRGMDNPLKITSITVSTGVLNFVWIEEAYQITTEAAFDMIDESIRGELPAGYFKQLTLTFNPWHESHWLKARFFDRDDDPRVLAVTTDYRCNEWLDDADLKNFEQMAVRNPRRYQTAGLGHWGITEGLVFENWERRDFDVDEIRRRDGITACYGLDFGYTAPTAFIFILADTKNQELYVCNELYRTGMTNRAIADWIRSAGYAKEVIHADAAEPKSIRDLQDAGIKRCRECSKGGDAKMHEIKFIQDYKIWIHPRCINFEAEISQYAWEIDKKTGKTLDIPVKDNDHLMDAMRYAVEEISKGRTFLLKHRRHILSHCHLKIHKKGKRRTVHRRTVSTLNTILLEALAEGAYLLRQHASELRERGQYRAARHRIMQANQL